MDALKLRDDDASRAALERAAAPTLAVLDDLATTGSPEWQIIANNLRGQLYVAMTVRLRNSIPLITQTSGPGYAALMTRHDRVEQKASPWLASADESFQKVGQIASANPTMGTNPVVAAAVRQSSASVVALAPTAKRPSASRG